MKESAKNIVKNDEKILLFLHAPILMTVVNSLVLAVCIDCFYNLFRTESFICMDYMMFCTVLILSIIILKSLPVLYRKNFYVVTDKAIKPIYNDSIAELPYDEIQEAFLDKQAFLTKSVHILKKDGNIIYYPCINHAEQLISYINLYLQNN
jgi:hypothetical protein